MAFAAATYAEDKKAEDIVIMDVRGISPVTDYYMLCTATSMPHLRAVCNEVRDRFWKEQELRPVAADENYESLWVILHYGDVMVHVFHKDRREFYALEDLWGDAPQVEWPPVKPKATKAKQKSETAENRKAPAKKAVAKKAAAKKTATKKTTAKKNAAKKTAAKKKASS